MPWYFEHDYIQRFMKNCACKSKFFPFYQDVTDELKNYQSVMEALHEQAANLGEQVGLCNNTLMYLIKKGQQLR